MKYTYKVGKKKVVLKSAPGHVAVRFKEPAKYSTRAEITEKCNLGAFRERIEVPEEKYTILPVDDQALVKAKTSEGSVNGFYSQKRMSHAQRPCSVWATIWCLQRTVSWWV